MMNFPPSPSNLDGNGLRRSPQIFPRTLPLTQPPQLFDLMVAMMAKFL